MIREAIARLVEHSDLSQGEAEGVMEEVMRGEATPAQISAFITALRCKGETPEEIAGCARAMRAHAVPVRPRRSDGLLDTCGTGGDGAGTFNISTLAALVVAAAGVPVAKHGNRSVSSRCGSADLLAALGVVTDLDAEGVARCIDEAGIGFLFAPRFHPAMKYATPVRRELGIRTVFNILGPLTNPASASAQLMGVYDPRLAPVLSRVLGLLGVKHALVVHGADGLDELSTTGPNLITELSDGEITSYRLDPSELGLPRASLGQLAGGSPEDNARITRSLLQGEKGPRRDVVLLNAAAALAVAGKAPDFADGLRMAAQAIDSGAAYNKLQELVALSQSAAGGGGQIVSR